MNGEATQITIPRLVNRGKRYISMTSRDIEKALRCRHGDSREWIFLVEQLMPNGTYVDAFALNCYASKGFKRVAYEIKVSRGDFLNEHKHPNKRTAGMEYSHEFYFAAPAGMLDRLDIPEGCGLLEVQTDGSTRIALKPPKKEQPPKNCSALLALAARNASGWRINRDRVRDWENFRDDMIRALEGYPEDLVSG